MKLCSRDRNSSHTLHTFASHRLSIVPHNTKKNSLLANDFKVPLLPRFILLLAESHLTSAQLNWRNTIFFEVFFFFVAKVLFDLISFRFQRSYIALPVAQKWEKIIALLNWNKANIRTRNWIKQRTHTHTEVNLWSHINCKCAKLHSTHQQMYQPNCSIFLYICHQWWHETTFRVR